MASRWRYAGQIFVDFRVRCMQNRTVGGCKARVLCAIHRASRSPIRYAHHPEIKIFRGKCHAVSLAGKFETSLKNMSLHRAILDSTTRTYMDLSAKLIVLVEGPWLRRGVPRLAWRNPARRRVSDSGFGLRVWGFGLRVSGLGSRNEASSIGGPAIG
jgi:hypothetical protein